MAVGLLVVFSIFTVRKKRILVRYDSEQSQGSSEERKKLKTDDKLSPSFVTIGHGFDL